MLAPEIIETVKALCKNGLDISHPPMVIPPLPDAEWTVGMEDEHLQLDEQVVRTAVQHLTATGEVESSDGVHFWQTKTKRR